MSKVTYKNALLQRFDPDIIERLDLRRIDLPVNYEIEFPGNKIDHLFFIEEGIASTTTTFKDGSQVEVVLAGWESVLGTSSMMGTKRSLNRVYMQIGGYGFSSRTEAAIREFKRGEEFQDLTLRYLQAQFILCAQTAGCNARHSTEQRFARWLLLCSDRIGEAIIPLAQEFIADMLGVRRSSVSIAAGSFQERKLIQYARGKLHLTDRAGLEKLTCECYWAVRDHLSNYTEDDNGFDM